jgi:membrane associated rhomboid family serine protease
MLFFTDLLPIGDDNRNVRHFPFVTYLLILANVAVFFLLQWQHPMFTYGYSVIPREILTGVDLVHKAGRIPQAPGPYPIYLTLFTAMFMHGSILHLGGNMLYLWIFGDNVEEAFGHGRFLLFYMICGLVAAFAQIAAVPHSAIPQPWRIGRDCGSFGRVYFDVSAPACARFGGMFFHHRIVGVHRYRVMDFSAID